MRDLPQAVGTHNPDKVGLGKPFGQSSECIGGVTGTEFRFEVADMNAGMTSHESGVFEALNKRGHAVAGLEWILRRDQPPQFIEGKIFQRQQADVAMAFMSRVE